MSKNSKADRSRAETYGIWIACFALILLAKTLSKH